MPAYTQQEYALQMIQQLRLLDPAASAAVGSPERKLLDTFAQALSENSVDLIALQGALNLDSKFGSNLDNFLALFRFGRQQASYATGWVEFGRTTASTSDINIPAGQRTQASINGVQVIFATTFSVILPAGETSVLAPIRAVTPGAIGNVAANTIVSPVGSPILGITTVNNPQPTRDGRDAEDDNSYKIRFKNTSFRNVAGTLDQYLALAVALKFSTRANVVGPISRYQEYIQVPEVDDATDYDIDGDTILESGGGNANEYTTAISSISYSKLLYEDAPIFVSNGQVGASAIFYRRDVDYRVNIDGDDKDYGDAKRLHTIGRGPDPTEVPTQPNVTFTNVYAGANSTIQSVRPNDIVLLEFSYLSDASRNDLDRGVTNCIDVFVDGGDEQLATVVLPTPTTANLIVDNPVSKFHYELYRRKGQPQVRPQIGNLLMPLMHQPVIELPDAIFAKTDDDLTYTFIKDVHYWTIEDVTELGGTSRARGGIEWNMDVPVDLAGHPSIFVTDSNVDTLTIEDYTYDLAIETLQKSLEDNKQITTDPLAHRAKRRYYKLDLTVMYTPGASIPDTNNQIREVVQSLFASQMLAPTLQLSDILQTVHTLVGVDNVRWTSDLPGAEDQNRLQETDQFGRQLVDVYARRRRTGTDALPEIQEIILTGSPTAGNYALAVTPSDIDEEPDYSTALAYNANAAAIDSALTALGLDVSVTGAGTASNPFVVTYTDNGPQDLIIGTPVPQRVLSTPVELVNGFRNLYSSTYILNSDFALKDDELPSLAETTDELTPGIYPDTVAGLIIRPRAQNTFGAR